MHAVLSSIVQLAVLYSNSSEKPNFSGCLIYFLATTTTFMRCMNKILYVSPRNMQTSQFFQLLQLIDVLFCLQRTFLPKIYCIYRIRYNDRQLFVYVTNNVSQDFPRFCSSDSFAQRYFGRLMPSTPNSASKVRVPPAAFANFVECFSRGFPSRGA